MFQMGRLPKSDTARSCICCYDNMLDQVAGQAATTAGTAEYSQSLLNIHF